MRSNHLNDEHWLRHALSLAQRAEALGEVPIGAVLVLDKDNTMIGEGWNQSIQLSDPTAHAEVVALRQAALHSHNYRLLGTTLYVTLEPCLMCVGAIIHARINRLVFGAFDPRTGMAGSLENLLQDKRLNHQVVCEGGLLASECGSLLQNFFKQKRL